MSGQPKFTGVLGEHQNVTSKSDKNIRRKDSYVNSKQSSLISVGDCANVDNTITIGQSNDINCATKIIVACDQNHHDDQIESFKDDFNGQSSDIVAGQREEDKALKFTSQNSSWKPEASDKKGILCDCSDQVSSPIPPSPTICLELHSDDRGFNNPTTATDGLINIGDIKHSEDKSVSLLEAATNLTSSHSSTPLPLSSHAHTLASNINQTKSTIINSLPSEPKKVRFKSLLTSVTSHDPRDEIVNLDERELISTTSFVKSSHELTHCDRDSSSGRDEDSCEPIQSDLDNEDNQSGDRSAQSFSSDDEIDDQLNRVTTNKSNGNRISSYRRSQSASSYFKGSQNSIGRRLLNRLKFFSPISFADSTSTHPYLAYEDKDLLTGARKSYPGNRKLGGGRTFRGSYKYSRAEISMAIFKKLASLLFQRSTAALLGAFLIHVTLGTVYTLSNINSYMTSYMRKHGSPNATYGASMWISSFYAIGQGLSMVLGGYLEKRFSARLSCILGCVVHSASIISTSWSVSQGHLAVLLTFGFLPGFGCGLAYMTPMSNGFGWFPNRRGLVAGVILAGFGIGTFIFNMAQTAFVNPENLSPPENAGGYFTQNSILDKVPDLFVFLGSIYAVLQSIGCCLLFKPPHRSDPKLSDERPILETELSFKRAIFTREFIVLFLVYGLTTQGILFVNSMIKEYGQLFIGNDMYLAWTGSMASIANSAGRLFWGVLIDRFSFTQCFTAITLIFGSLMFIMPFEFVLSSKLMYLLCTLGIFGSFSGWMSTYPVHLSRVFGRTNSGMIYGLIFVSQSIGGIFTALGAHYLIDHFDRFVPFYCVVILEVLGLGIYHLFYPK